jgi:hypothetical protein
MKRALLHMAVLGFMAGFTGCGEATFDAREFVDRANAEGAGLELGEELTATAEDVEIWAVRFADASGRIPPASPGASGGSVRVPDLAHGAASLAVVESAGDAEEEFERCEATATLTCFRAANVVVRVENATNQEIDRLTEAIAALES